MMKHVFHSPERQIRILQGCKHDSKNVFVYFVNTELHELDKGTVLKGLVIYKFFGESLNPISLAAGYDVLGQSPPIVLA